MKFSQNNTETSVQNNTQTASTTTMSAVTLLVTLLALLIAVAGVSFYIWYGMQHTPNTVADTVATTTDVTVESDTSAPLTSEQKMNTLNSLNKNPKGLTTEEKRVILENLNN